RRDEYAHPGGWQKVCYGIWRGDIVVDEQPCRALLSKPTQRRLGGLLNVGFLRRRRTQRHGEAREGAQETRARLGGTPTHARVQTSEAVRILDGQRGLAHAAHPLHGHATYRRLRDGSGFVLHQDGVEAVEFVSATCETCDTRWHPNEGSRWRRCRLRFALSGGDDATPALLGIINAYKVLVDVVGQKTHHRRVIATQDHDVPLL